MRRLLAMVLWWVAVLLLVGGNLASVVGWLDVPVAVWIGAGLIAIGLNVVIAGDLAVMPDAKPVSARAEVSRAVLDVQADLSNLDVRAGDGDRLAALHLGRGSSPQIQISDGVAHLHMGNKRRWLPVSANWRANLATNVLWDVTVHSLIGHLDIDLRNVRVDIVKLKSSLGDILLKCPRRGTTHLELETVLGDVEIVVPHQAGARITIQHGNMAHVSLDAQRFEQLDDGSYATLDIESAVAVAEISLQTRAGEVRLS